MWKNVNYWLGKLSRFVKDIQGHMRLRASGDRHEIRQQYLPVLWNMLVKALELKGSDAECVEDIIQLMDSYFLTKEDWDAIMELGVGPQDAEKVKLNSQVKANFTRKYNAASHPLPFIKASASVPPAAKGAKVKPDLEEAIDESDDDALVELAAEDEEEEELDLKKDKYVQAPKKRKATAKKPGKAATGGADKDGENDSDEPPSKKAKTKGRGTAKATRGRPKK